VSDDDILTPAEVARHLRVSVRLVTMMCNRDELPGSFKVGSRWRIPRYVIKQLGDHGSLQEGQSGDEVAGGDLPRRRETSGLDSGRQSQRRRGIRGAQARAYCADHYRPFAEPRLKARTWTNRVYTIGTLSKYLGDLRLTDLKKPVLEKYQNDRLGERIKPSTINDEIKILRAICSHARANGVPCVELAIDDLPVRGKRKVMAWNDEQVAALLSSVRERSPHIYGLVLFLLNTGCRRGEALALEWSAVDLRRRLIRIEPSEEWQPKNNEAREIPISDRLLLYFNTMHKAKRWVFPADTGDRYAFWPQLAFDRARKAAGLVRIQYSHGGSHRSESCTPH
jgi:integrase